MFLEIQTLLHIAISAVVDHIPLDYKQFVELWLGNHDDLLYLAAFLDGAGHSGRSD